MFLHLQPINNKSTQNIVKVCEETEKCFQCDDECDYKHEPRFL